jgi:hypothetical protein
MHCRADSASLLLFSTALSSGFSEAASKAPVWQGIQGICYQKNYAIITTRRRYDEDAGVAEFYLGRKNRNEAGKNVSPASYIIPDVCASAACGAGARP